MIQSPKTIGAIIKIIRKKQSMTQLQLAEISGVTRNYIALLERGNRKPSYDCLEKIAQAVGIPLGDIVLLTIQCEPADDEITVSQMSQLQKRVLRNI